jgi:hypothetical protein
LRHRNTALHSQSLKARAIDKIPGTSNGYLDSEEHRRRSRTKFRLCGAADPDQDPGRKKHQKFLNISSFEELDILYAGLKASSGAYLKVFHLEG